MAECTCVCGRHDGGTAIRMLGASLSRGFDGGVRTATEHDARDAAARRPPRDGRVPGEQAKRAAIFCQHVGAELTDASLLSRTKDLFEEDRTESESLPTVLPVGDFGDERHPLAIVDVGEGVRLLWKEPPEGEESLVRGAWAQPMAQRHQARLVVGADRAEANGGAVAQCHWFTLARSRCPAARPWAPHRRPGRRPRPPWRTGSSGSTGCRTAPPARGFRRR